MAKFSSNEDFAGKRKFENRMIDYVRIVDYSFFVDREICVTRWVTFTLDNSLYDCSDDITV